MFWWRKKTIGQVVEEKKIEGIRTKIGLKSNNVVTALLSEEDAKRLLREFTKKSGKCLLLQPTDGHTLAIDMASVDAVLLHEVSLTNEDLYPKEREKVDNSRLIKQIEEMKKSQENGVGSEYSLLERIKVKIEKPKKEEVPKEPVEDDGKAQFKIECKCGHEYYARMHKEAQKARCRACQERVYRDPMALVENPLSSKPAWLMTNRYYVKNEELERQRQEWLKSQEQVS